MAWTGNWAGNWAGDGGFCLIILAFSLTKTMAANDYNRFPSAVPLGSLAASSSPLPPDSKNKRKDKGKLRAHSSSHSPPPLTSTEPFFGLRALCGLATLLPPMKTVT